MGSPLDSILGSRIYEGEIRDLETELDDVLSFIAYDNGAEDRDYVIKRAKEIKEKYSPFVERLGDGWDKLESALGLTIDSIQSAFDGFIWLVERIEMDGKENYVAEEVRQEAEDLVGEFLNYDPDIDNVAYAYASDEEKEIWSKELHLARFGF